MSLSHRKSAPYVAILNIPNLQLGKDSRKLFAQFEKIYERKFLLNCEFDKDELQ